MHIVKPEAHQAADHRAADHAQIAAQARSRSDNRHRRKIKHGHARAQAVQAVQQVRAVGRAHDDKHHQRDIQDAQIKLRLQERNFDAGTDHWVEIAVHRERQRQNRLEEHLLFGGQARVLAAADLGHVVRKADAHIAQRHQNYGQRHILHQRHAVIVHQQAHHDRRAGERQAAHDRRTLLLFVRLGRQLIDVLAKLQLIEHREQQLAQQRADRESQHHREHHPLHGHSSESSAEPKLSADQLFCFISSRSSWTISFSSNGYFTPQMS